MKMPRMRKVAPPGHYRPPRANVPGKMNVPGRGRVGKQMPQFKKLGVPKAKRRG